jgi:hypothetical protein
VESLLEADIIISHVASISFDASQHKSLVLRRQEAAIFREGWNSWPANNADKDGDTAFDDEDPIAS